MEKHPKKFLEECIKAIEAHKENQGLNPTLGRSTRNAKESDDTERILIFSTDTEALIDGVHHRFVYEEFK